MALLSWIWKFLLLVAVSALLIGVLVWWRTNIIVEVDEGALPAAVAAPAPVDFSVITYNVQARPLFDKTGAKFDAISPTLNPYDIVAIQECFYNHEDLWEGTTHPVRIYHNTRRHPLKIVNSGLSLLGRFPIEGVESAHYSVDGDQQNWPANKGILMAHFRVGGMPLDVYTSHFAAGKHERSRRDKPTQSREAIEFIQAHSPPEHAVIFLGDFNMKSIPEEERLTPEELEKGMELLPTFNRDQCFQVIKHALGMTDVAEELYDTLLDEPDHILYRSGTAAQLEATGFHFDGDAFYFENGEPLSDHEPLIAEFRLSPPVAP